MRDMHTGLWRRLIAALAPIVVAASVHAQPLHDDRWGWNYCAPPYPPACANDAGPAKTSACARDVKMFIDLVIAYRICQTRELERAILEANRVVDAFQCRTDKRSCDPRKGE